jgi:hypothetical protein
LAPNELSIGSRAITSARQIVNQSKWISDVASGKVRFVFDDLAAFFRQPSFSLFDILDRDFE